MKKIVCSLLCIICAMSLLLCGCLFEDPASNLSTNDAAPDAQGESDVAVQATLSAALYDNDVAQLEIIGSGTFYFKGTMISETGEKTPMEMASKDGATYMGSKMDGIEIGIMNIGQEYYMVYPEGECALLLDDAVCATLDMDPSEMKLDTSSLSLGEVGDELLVNTADALVDTTIATCRTYQQPDGNFVKTYISEGRLIRLQQVRADGVVLNTMDIEILTDAVPADRSAIPSGYKVYSGTVGMMSFMMKFASSVGMDALTQ